MTNSRRRTSGADLTGWSDGALSAPPRHVILPPGPFDFIAADPPWQFQAWKQNLDDRNTRAVERHYETQTLEWICAQDVASVAATNTHLALWITGPMLVRGAHLTVMEAWGFKPSSMAWIWIKVNKKAMEGRFHFPGLSHRDFFMSLGHTTRQNAEYVVLGRRGRPKRHDRASHQLIVEPRREHSRKPEEFYRRAEAYAGKGARMLDLFSRQERPGWTAAGNEVHKFAVEASGDGA